MPDIFCVCFWHIPLEHSRGGISSKRGCKETGSLVYLLTADCLLMRRVVPLGVQQQWERRKLAIFSVIGKVAAETVKNSQKRMFFMEVHKEVPIGKDGLL